MKYKLMKPTIKDRTTSFVLWRKQNLIVKSIERKEPYLKWYALIVTAFLGLKFTQLLGVLSSISYALLFIVAIITTVIFFNSSKKDISFLALFFLLAGALSLMDSQLNKEFRPIERYLLFVIMFIGYGPVLQSKMTNSFRYLVFNYIQIWFVIITLGSFVTYFLRLPFAFGNAGFKGLTPHSMDLSPIAALASLYSMTKIRDCIKKQKVLWIVVFIICLSTMLLAASRGAILGFFVSILFYFIISYRRIGRSLTPIILVTGFVIALIWINPFSIMSGIEEKIERTEKLQDFSGGRNKMFETRYKEFHESPIFGVGFSSMRYTHINEKGYFEPGSGWVFILSSTGLAGFVFALWLCLRSINNSRRFPRLSLLSSTCLFFVIHSMIEGYILTVSNGFCIYMWMVVGLAANKKYLEYYA